ncbi:hypothetical protein B6A27_15580 [Anoxybacillus sp. UARK-01]|uniref:IS3 family transposase n=1 Tax=Anoxybacillus sp. UARK-01 TaxID=1895648 RepID=UPI0009BB9105|nr:hypothetical protein B6A27_15580 [Anoxybacillus sp. UARK-01]
MSMDSSYIVIKDSNIHPLIQQRAKKYNIKASMSRKGNGLDNACMEHFFRHFKAKCFNLYSFRTAEEVKEAVHQSIRFYNHHRFQKKLHNLSPYEYRTQAA